MDITHGKRRIKNNMSNSNYIVAKNKYGKYCIPVSTKHRISCKTVLDGKVWEEETVNFIITHCKGDLVHAGAYFGDMLPAFSSSSEKVWTFEPSKENYECASNTIQWNNLTNVYLTNAALGRAVGSAELQTEGIRRRKMVKLVGDSLITHYKYIVGKTETVEIVTIDNMVPEDRFVSIIHLDVEFYELPALQGAVKTIERCSPIIILEIKHNKVDPNLCEFLEQMGYEKDNNIYFDNQNCMWKRKV